MGGEFHDVKKIHDRTRQDLLDAVAFQKQIALAMCHALDSRFGDKHVMAAFRVLGPTNTFSKQVGLANLGVVDLNLLCE